MWHLFNLDADLRRLLNLDFLLFSDVINNVSASLSCPNCINGPYRKCWNPRKLNCGYQTFYLYDPKKIQSTPPHIFFRKKLSLLHVAALLLVRWRKWGQHNRCVCFFLVKVRVVLSLSEQRQWNLLCRFTRVRVGGPYISWPGPHLRNFW
jgi:hypothetical protein